MKESDFVLDLINPLGTNSGLSLEGLFKQQSSSNYNITEGSANHILLVQKQLLLIRVSVDLLWWII